MVLSHTVEPVGVGFPNPSGEETSPLRWMTHRKLCPHLAPEGRHVYSTAAYTKHTKAPEGRHIPFV